jgi:hypothetical protein
MTTASVPSFWSSPVADTRALWADFLGTHRDRPDWEALSSIEQHVWIVLAEAEQPSRKAA